jgi:hypothetical protein
LRGAVELRGLFFVGWLPPPSIVTEGMLIRETRENAHGLAGCATRMLSNLEVDFHEIYPVAELTTAGARG